jgi:hypothetical protein
MVLDLMAPGVVTGGTIPTRHAMARALKAYKNFAKPGSEIRKALMKGLRKGVTLTEAEMGPLIAGRFTEKRMLGRLERALAFLAGEKPPTAYDINISPRTLRVYEEGQPFDAFERLAHRRGTSVHELGHLTEANLPRWARDTLRDMVQDAGEKVSPRARTGSLTSESFAIGLEDLLAPIRTPDSPFEILNLLDMLSKK